MAEIEAFPTRGNYEARKARLEGLSREASILIAARAALRVVPLLDRFLIRGNHIRMMGVSPPQLVLDLLRCHLLPLAASLAPVGERKRFAAAAADANVAASTAATFLVTAGTTVTTRAARSAAAAAAAADVAAAAADAADVAAAAADAIAIATAAADAAFAAAAFVRDCEALRARKRLAPVAAMPLWPEGMPGALRNTWAEFAPQLRALGDDWDIWAEWYETLLPGAKEGRFLFGLPTKPALQLLHDVALLDNALWKDPPKLNARFRAMVEEARGEDAGSAYPDAKAKPLPPGQLQPNPAQPMPRKAGVKKLAAKPKTVSGAAILKNAVPITLEIELLFPLIDEEIRRLRDLRPNSEESEQQRDAQIAALEGIRVKLASTQNGVIAYSEGALSEREAVQRTKGLLEQVSDWWRASDKELLLAGARSGVFLGAISIASLAGVKADPKLATLVLGAIAAKKPLVEVLKAAKGIFNFKFGS